MLPVHCLKQNPHIHFESASLFSGFDYIFVLLKQEFCSNEWVFEVWKNPAKNICILLCIKGDYTSLPISDQQWCLSADQWWL